MDRRLAMASDARSGLITRADALAVGVPARTWSRRQGTESIERIHPGVARQPGRGTMSDRDRIHPAVLSCSDAAMASHRSAAFLWGALPLRPGDPVDVIVCGRTRRVERSGVTVHRPRDAVDLVPVTRDGVPCTGIVRLLVDIGAINRALTARVLDHFLIAELVTFAEARAAESRHSRQGRAGVVALRMALDEIESFDGGADSALELRFHRMTRRFALPDFDHHAVIEGYEVDFVNRRYRTIVEIDGWAYHGDRSSFERDRLRDLRLAAAGWLVVRLTWAQLTAEQPMVARQLRAVLAARADLGTG